MLPDYCKNDTVENYVFSHDVFSPGECLRIIEESKKLYLDTAEIQQQKDSVYNQDIRDSKICFIDYDNRNFDWLFDKITAYVIPINNKCFNFDIWGFQEGLQFTEYNAPSGHYSEHTDKLLKGLVRKLTIVIQLTDENEYEGGELQFFLGGEPTKAPRKQGTVIIFPSYILHSVTPTTKGTRHSLVGWITGSPFK